MGRKRRIGRTRTKAAPTGPDGHGVRHIARRTYRESSRYGRPTNGAAGPAVVDGARGPLERSAPPSIGMSSAVIGGVTVRYSDDPEWDPECLNVPKDEPYHHPLYLAMAKMLNEHHVAIKGFAREIVALRAELAPAFEKSVGLEEDELTDMQEPTGQKAPPATPDSAPESPEVPASE